jgi:hypothetical protein
MFDSLIQAIQNARSVNIYNDKFCDSKLSFLPQRTFDPIEVKSLDGLIAYVNDLSDSDEAEVAAIVVRTHAFVEVVGHADPVTGNRQVFIQAKAEVPEFSFGTYIERERFQIAIASKFFQTENRDKLIQVLGQVAEDSVKQTDDDGISQTVTVKTGITLKGEVVVPSMITLAPYRTFVEIDQPESEFLIRMRSGGSLECSLFEADGGAWKLEARNSIKQYLAEALEGVTILI